MKNVFFILFTLILLFSCTEETIVEVKEVEDSSTIVEVDFDLDLKSKDLNLFLKSTETNKIFSTRVEVFQNNGKTYLDFHTIPENGNYVMLYYVEADEYIQSQGQDDLLVNDVVGEPLGMEIHLGEESMKLCDEYNKELDLYGTGTKADPYIISSFRHFKKLAHAVNVDKGNSFAGVYFKQECDISVPPSSAGIEPVGTRSAYPFSGIYDGGNYKIKNLKFNNSNFSVWALFGYVYGASFYNIVIESPQIKCMDFGSALVAVVITPGNKTQGKERGLTVIKNCHVTSTDGSFIEGQVGIGALVGAVDQFAMLKMIDCSNETSVKGAVGVGGLVGLGNQTSKVVIESCLNAGIVSSVTSQAHYSGIGGIVGSSDTCAVFLTENKGNVITPETMNSKCVGGIVGGTRLSVFNCCKNSAKICGGRGVGGILGSNVLKIGEGTEATIYQTALHFSSVNSGNVSGCKYVGGVMGEGQLVADICYNEGNISASEGEAGGLVSCSPTLCVSSVANFGNVSGYGRSGGISSNSRMNNIIGAYNFGNILVSGEKAITGGILGESGNNGAVHYSYNWGKIINKGESSITGGLIGMTGEDRTFSTLDITSLCLTSVFMLTGTIGDGLSLASFNASNKVVESIMSYTFDIALPLADAVSSGILDFISWMNFDPDYEYIPSKDNPVIKNMNAQNIVTRDKMNHTIGIRLNNLFLENVPYSEYCNLEHLFNQSSKFIEKITVEDNYLRNVSKKLDKMKNKERNKMAEFNKNMELSTMVISSALSIIGSICSIIATAGAAAPLMAALSVTTTVLSGSASLISTTNSYQENVGLVTQCANFGDLEVNNSYKYAGSLIGKMNDNTEIFDSYNWGGNKQRLKGGLVGYLGDKIQAKRCINYSTAWTSVYQTTLGAVDPITSLNNFKVISVAAPPVDPNFKAYEYGIQYYSFDLLQNDKEIYKEFSNGDWYLGDTLPIHSSESSLLIK